jgi:hypothetical protein
MALTIPYTFTNATIAEAGEVNSNNTAIKNFVDALQTGVNIDTAAITTAKIAQRCCYSRQTCRHRCCCWFVHNGRYHGRRTR